ncbi:MAG TPA: hypothetical protein VHN80_00985, partial [Kineosporiaceae bacterium]|nr:hypothetical protein [Kineosporiaceae bacterium]
MLTIASDRAKGRGRRGPARRAALLLAGAAALVTGAVSVGVAPSAQAATGQKLDLRVLVVDDGSGRVDPLSQAMTLEGLPFTTVTLGDPSRPLLTAAFLASGTEGRFQAIVLPNESGPGLSVDEAAALRTYETTFGVRQVDAYTSGGSALGLDAPGYNGPLNGMTAAVTADGQAQGFGYLTGPVPMAIGSYGYLSMPLSPLPAGTTFTSLVTAPIPGTDLAGSLVGAFTSAGRSELAITMNYNPGQSHFRMLAHGIISWMTQGIHFGYNRNNFTFHFDDAFAPDARWDMDNNCTPGEDCPATVAATPDIRMTAEDVAHVAAWVQTSGYKPTLAFNGYYSQYDSNGAPWNGMDGLTNALLANKDSFRWLNHGYVHIYQGCVQNFAVAPWTCATTTPEGAVAWTSEADISSEITANITQGNALGLSFDATEYLSGEHSGLQSLPQMPTDNPNFAAALTANGIKVIGSDASRETGTRTVGSAQTIPRHPTALYYNTSTAAEAVDEYNWFYAPSPAGNCVATSTTTCLPAPLDGSSGTVPGTTPA